jgi:putative metalloprotease
MLRLLLPVLLVAGIVFLWKLRAQMSGHGLRKRSRPLANDQLDALLARLARAAGIDRVEVRLLPDGAINGLATDTGEIYITQGLLDAFRSGKVTARELASVAAHELGHLALGHMRRRMVEVAGRQAAYMVLGGILGRFVPYVGWMAAAWLLGMLAARLSRRDEFEADAYATALMVRSGVGAEHQATLLEKLPRLIPGSAAMATSWLASHPPVEERAAAIRENARRWRDHAPQVSE